MCAGEENGAVGIDWPDKRGPRTSYQQKPLCRAGGKLCAGEEKGAVGINRSGKNAVLGPTINRNNYAVRHGCEMK